MKAATATVLFIAIFAALNLSHGLLQLSGDAQGDFVIIGTFCVPRKVTDLEKVAGGKATNDGSNPQMTIKITNGDPSSTNQKILLYTDGASNLQSVSKGGQSCESRAELSQKICVDGGKTCYKDGYPIGAGQTELSIEITQARNRQWFVAVANCDSKTTKGGVKAVDITKYNVQVNVVEDCATMRKPDSVVGYVIIIVIAAVLMCFFSGLTYKFYKDSEDINVLKARYGGYDDVSDSSGL
jgi:hypothetical protein